MAWMLDEKIIKGKPYWYLVRKGRKNGVPTNVETIYIGKADRLAALLQGSIDDALSQAFPSGFQSREVGASAALWQEVEALGLVQLIDSILGCRRRSDAAVSYGQLLVVAAIQRAIAPRRLKSCNQLRNWYEGCGVADFVPVDSVGLDPRRVYEALSQLTASDVERIEHNIIARMVRLHNVSVDTLAFDATNFDSYAAAGTTSTLLKRGNAKSKRKNLRILGLGLLVTADDGLPLLSFTYPGNRPDVRSFKSFLRRLKRRRDELGVGEETTIVCDGGNISKDVVVQLEREPFQFVTRLPSGHAAEADALKTTQLPWVAKKYVQKVRAKKIQTQVYGQERTVVAVYSSALDEAQRPGLRRDIKKARTDLEKLRQRLEKQSKGKAKGKLLTRAAAIERAKASLGRQHMSLLFPFDVTGTDEAPILTFRFDTQAWKKLKAEKLGRTAILTSKSSWSPGKIVQTLRAQSHAEEAFRLMKDPEWASSVPLRHYTDGMLRVHAFISVLGLLLSKLVIRRLRLAGVEGAVVEALYELSQLQRGKLRYGKDALPQLKSLAKKREVPPDPTPRQWELIKGLKLQRILAIGPTHEER